MVKSDIIVLVYHKGTIMKNENISEYFSREIASPLDDVKKSKIGRERELKTLTNYTQVKNIVINIG